MKLYRLSHLFIHDNNTASNDTSTLSLHDALPILSRTTFHHLNDIPHVIKQMKGILNDGGKIVILDNVSKVETPATYVYILGAIQEFLPHCFKFGMKNAIRIFRHNTSKPWLEHLASDKYLSEQ